MNGLLHVLDEVQITHIIQQLRVLNAASQENRSPEEWFELQRKHSRMHYSDLDSEPDLDSSNNSKSLKSVLNTSGNYLKQASVKPKDY